MTIDLKQNETMANNISMDGNNGQASNLPLIEDVEGRINQMHETIISLQNQVQTKAVKIWPPEAFNGTWSKL